MLILENSNTTCSFLGVSQESMEKKKFMKAETLAGVTKQSYSDMYSNVSVQVTIMTAADYKNLKIIFGSVDNIYLTDEDGIRRKVLFKTNTLGLKKQFVEARDENIYSGTLNFIEN